MHCSEQSPGSSGDSVLPNLHLILEENDLEEVLKRFRIANKKLA